MKLLNFMLFFIVMIGVSGCKNSQENSQTAANESSSDPGNIPEISYLSEQQNREKNSGTVTEVITAGGYTYMKVDKGTEQIWVGAMSFNGKVGDLIIVEKAVPLSNYHSDALDRNFEKLYFGEVTVSDVDSLVQQPPSENEEDASYLGCYSEGYSYNVRTLFCAINKKDKTIKFYRLKKTDDKNNFNYVEKGKFKYTEHHNSYEWENDKTYTLNRQNLEIRHTQWLGDDKIDHINKCKLYDTKEEYKAAIKEEAQKWLDRNKAYLEKNKI